jgi:hypothetical protein
MALPDYNAPDDHSGRDPLVAKHHSTLKATKTVEDTDSIDSDRVPYQDLQKSPNRCQGRFAYAWGEGTLDICSYENHIPHTRAVLKLRNDMEDNKEVTYVSIELPEDNNGD